MYATGQPAILFIHKDSNGDHFLQKLRPFFPPVEPLQSVNLRAALFRVLSDLKKNGDLGREAILRKTMLDECKGDKFEELLALFSTSVLRRVLSSRKSTPDNIAMRIVMSNKLTESQQEALLPLILAHRVSIATLMKERKQLGESYERYDKLFRSTLDEVAERAKGVKQPTKHDVDAFDRARRDIEDSWQGCRAWADTILKGGSNIATNPFLEVDFPRAWLVIRKGGALSDIQTSQSTDLLADLDSRIAQQRSRLQRWKEFRKTLAAERRSAGVERRKETSTPLLFRQHQELSVHSKKDDRPATIQADEYQRFVTDMEYALSNIQGCSLPSMEPLSPVTQERQASPRHSVQRAALNTPSAKSPISNEGLSPRIVQPANSSGRNTPERDLDLPSPMHNIKRSDTPSIIIEPDLQEEPKVTIEDTISQSLHNEFDPEPQEASTLMERTRKSMSLLPAPTATKRHSLARQSRQSQTFPVNQFETPRKGGQTERTGAITPQSDLFSQDADYASVFKSRPKIAMSPVNTPPVLTPSFGDMDGAYDEDEDQTQDVSLASSPWLVGRGGDFDVHVTDHF